MRFDGLGSAKRHVGREAEFRRSLRRAASAAAAEALRSFVRDGGGLVDRLRAAADRVVDLRGLEPGARDALWLVDGLGFGVREAAELAGCDEITLKRRLAEGRRSIVILLRAQLRRYAE